MDIEVALMTFFDDLAYTVTVADYSALSGLITQYGGVLRIRRVGGGADRDTDEPSVSIQAYAVATSQNPRAPYDLADAVWSRFLEVLNGTRSGWVAQGVAFEEPSKTSGPVEVPSPQTTPQITVVESIYRLTVRQ